MKNLKNLKLNVDFGKKKNNRKVAHILGISAALSGY